ncbi:BlaI/MecI/CopY family transcriptional regulator [Knoellia koreensis]|uniref:BlaI/MecI/CopY family transcriptional regulator n=1 Tax=Knoellia koreensis TaxID=2730921 RepID=A0A849HDQ0_9MICO|nr:BlaI/MecI/CopY family transcriptional regulator [Knoellia sp. DB2414S]NNM47856.1 BlaI/MecI/CopY family transcriptional regulator [Knoellia sp. DB2414S]
MRELGGLERAIMDRLWGWNRPATVREVLEDLNRERKVAYTTVMTVMTNLERKGLLSRALVGRAYAYAPVAAEADHTAALIAEAVGDGPDRTTPLLRFVSQLSAGEIEQLRTALESESFKDSRRFRRRGRT